MNRLVPLERRLLRTSRKSKLDWTLLALTLLIATATLANPSRTPPPRLPSLTQAKQILRLSRVEAHRGYPARLRGVITYVDREFNMIFLQDATGGVYISDYNLAWKPKPGDFIEATGQTNRGAFIPIFVLKDFKRLGVSPLPAPRKASSSDLLSGLEDSQWVETTGIIQSAHRDGPRLIYHARDSRVQYDGMIYGVKSGFPVESLIDSEARIRGVCAVKIDSNGKLAGFGIYSPGLTDLQIAKPGPKDPYSLPLSSSDQILQASRSLSAHRIRAEGVVTYADPTGRLAIQDRIGGLFLETHQALPKLGDRVEAIGFPSGKDGSLTLQNAEFRRMGKGAEPQPQTIDASADQIEKSVGKLVRMRARLLSNSFYAGNTLFILQSEKNIFKASLSRPLKGGASNALVDGSMLEVTGVCYVFKEGFQQSFQILLRDPHDILVLRQPPWWNQRRVWTFIGVSSLLILSALGWGFYLAHRVKTQADLLRSLKREKEYEERYRHLFENAKEMVWTLDIEGRFTSLNQAGEAILGRTRDEALELSLDQFIEEKRRVAFYEWLQSVDDRFAPLTQEFTIVSEDGRRITIEANMRMIFQEERPIGFEGIARDITERKRAERELEVSNQQLQDALEELQRTQSQVIRQERLRALGQMASGIAHDFNNALMPILGFSELLIHRPEYLADREKSNHYLQLIASSAQGAAKTVSRLREFYRNRDEEDERSPVDLRSLVSQAIDLTEPKWKDEARAKGRSIEIRSNLSPNRMIVGDAGDLRESLINLILNAVDAMPEGGLIEIETRQEGEDAIVEVRDDGVGMSQETKEKCLEPFFTTKEKRGTGLGLAMVHGIVSRHGGSIEIESAERRGSTFRLRLPSTEERIESKLVETEDPTKRDTLRILLAEDDPAIREYLIERLRMEGHRIDEARDGQEGWERYQSGSFDLVITDYSMPRMSGEGLSRLIKERDPRTPILMLTGFGDLIKGKDQAPDSVDLILSKPLRFEELRTSIGALTRS